LIRKMEIHSVEEIQDCVDRYYPDDVLQPSHRETIRLLISRVWS